MTRVLIRKLAETGVTPLGNLVKADAHHAIVEADRVVAEAEAEGRRACEAAATRGRETGEEEGRKAAAALMAKTVAEAHGYLRGSETRLVGIVTDAVRRIIGAVDDEELVSRVVRQLVGEASGEGGVKLRVSPRDVPAVREWLAGARSELSDIESVEVVADAGVPEGACRMETALGFVTSSVDERLELLRAALEAASTE